MTKFRAFVLAATAVLAIPSASLAAHLGRGVEESVLASGRARVIITFRDRQAAFHAGVEVTARWNNVHAVAATIDASSLPELAASRVALAIDLDSGGSGGDAESLPLIGGNIVHAEGYAGKNVTVAVIDSGLDETHPDLLPVLIDEHCFCRNSDGSGCCPNRSTEQSGAGSARDEAGHGTNVTGIIASQGTIAPIGVAPGVKVVAVRVLDANNAFASTSQVISALDWVYDHHPEVKVINMSLLTSALFSGPCDTATAFTSAFAEICDKFRTRGTAVFACSGNNASPVTIGAPACVASVIAVGAVYDSNVGSRLVFGCSDPTTAADQITCFSNASTALDLLGPGAVITSTGMGGGLSSYIGTSQATPHAAGSAAVLFSIRPDLTVDDVEQVLKSSGKPIFDSRNGLTTPRIDLLAAVEAVRPNPPRRHAAAH